MKSILFEVEESVGMITLNRPEKLNSFNREMAGLLLETLDECAKSTIRAVYLTGSGKAFSAGQDLGEVPDPSSGRFDGMVAEYYNPIVSKIRNLQKPVLCAVNGVAAGAGANMALCCDIVLAAQSASFIQAFSKIGLIPDSGGTYILPRLVGWQVASALAMLGDKITAPEAERMGMIYRSLPDEGFQAATLAYARSLAAMPTRGLALIKQALNQSLSNTWEGQLRLEDQLQSEAAQTRDFREGVSAFLEKRKPEFKGI